MTDNTKLIEARQALDTLHRYSFGSNEIERNQVASLVEVASDALAVFEKAHTPTDDEREALRAEAEKVQRAAWAEIHGQDPTRTYSVAEVKQLVYSFDNVLSSTLRRSETPSTQPVRVCGPCSRGQHAPCDRANEFWGDCTCSCNAAEPQAKPSSEVPEPIAEPTDRTSNFGWAIWHLTKAKAATSIEEAQMHAVAASARAQLQVAAEMGATRGVDPNGPSTWQEDWS